MGIQGVCRETVRRPVVRFIDFYRAAEEARKPPSLFEKIAYGLALVATGQPQADPSRQRQKVDDH